VILIVLVKKLFKKELGSDFSTSYNKNPLMDVQFLDNLSIAFKLLEKAGIDINGVGPPGRYYGILC
jgi:hypothetical protein